MGCLPKLAASPVAIHWGKRIHCQHLQVLPRRAAAAAGTTVTTCSRRRRRRRRWCCCCCAAASVALSICCLPLQARPHAMTRAVHSHQCDLLPCAAGSHITCMKPNHCRCHLASCVCHNVAKTTSHLVAQAWMLVHSLLGVVSRVGLWPARGSRCFRTVCSLAKDTPSLPAQPVLLQAMCCNDTCMQSAD